MKKLILFFTFFISISVHALPNCPSDVNARWHNCFATYTFGPGEFYGDVYVGEWKDSLRHGQGTYTYANGDKYVGAYKDGKQNGQGTFTFADGDKYVGEFKDSLFHGQGTYTFADGERYAGFFMNDGYIPQICENMGLRKGSDEFGKCVNNLIEDL